MSLNLAERPFVSCFSVKMVYNYIILVIVGFVLWNLLLEYMQSWTFGPHQFWHTLKKSYS